MYHTKSLVALLATMVSFSAAQNSTNSTNAVVTALQGDPDLSMLLTAVSAVPGLAATLGNASNITVLAPTNEAFMALSSTSAEGRAATGNNPTDLAALLSYHIINGTLLSSNITNEPNFLATHLNSSNTIGGSPQTNVTGGQRVEFIRNGTEATVISGNTAASTITQANITAGNITIHKINRVLTVPQNLTDVASNFGLTAAAGAIRTAALGTTLDTVSDLTIFVPNNVAFESIGSILSNISTATLTQILQYHVITGRVFYSPSISNTSFTTLSGGDVTFTVTNNSVFVNNARVVVPNILLSNGVAHVIDGVLNPNATSVATSSLVATATVAPPAFSSASSATLAFTTNLPVATTTAVPPPVASTAAVTSATTTGGAAPMRTAGAAAGAGALLAGALLVL